MRLTFVTPGLTPSGGMLAIVEFANRLATRGHQVTMAGLGTRQGAMHQELQSAVKLMEVGSAGGRYLSPANVLAGLRLSAAVPGCDVVIATHTSTIVPTLIASRLLRRGKAVWLNQDYPEQFSDRPFFVWMLKWAPRQFDQVATISQANVEETLAMSGVRPTLLGYAFSHREIWTEQKWIGPDSRPPVASAISDLRPWKGLGDLVVALEKVKSRRSDLRAIIFSWTPRPAMIPDWIDWRTGVGRPELAASIAATSLFVSASWAESFGLPPLEVMASGVPVVVTDSRGALEYARHFDNCLVTPPKDPNALAAAIERLLGDRELMLRFAASGRETASRFAWKGPVDRLERVLQAVTLS